MGFADEVCGTFLADGVVEYQKLFEFRPSITRAHLSFYDNGGIGMEGPLRGILAGAAAWKFGGGCISTILIFIIVFWLLGYVRC
jgi:hypothetical protein